MTSKTRSGVVLLAGREFPATVTLSVVPTPGSPIGRQQVEVRFHGEAPPEHLPVIVGEATFREHEGGSYILQNSGRRWLLKDTEEFLT